MNGVSLKGGMPYLARLIVASLAFICLLPQRFFGSLGTGLDASWQLALHMAVDAGRVFGRDFLFTYGPLGVLSTRLPFDSSYLLLLAFDLFFYGFLLYAFWRLCQRLETAIQYGILCAVCFFAGELVYGADLVIALFGLCLLFLYLFEESGRWLDFLLACLLAIVIFYVKLNMGFAVLLCVVGVLCSIAVDAHRRLRAAIGVIVFIALLSASTLLVRVDLPAYIVGSFEIASGYNEAMVMQQRLPSYYLWWALLCVFTLLVVFVLSLRENLTSLRALLLAGMVIGFTFLLFKQSFVRADEHIYTFFHFAALPGALWALFAGSTVRRWIAIALTPALAAGCFISYGYMNTAYFTKRSEQFVSYLTQLMHGPSKYLPSAVPESAQLPANFLNSVRNKGVDVIPWEISYAFYNKLHYEPRPVMQSYSAYTAYLDGLNAAKYSGDSAPQYLIFSPYCVDHRYCAWVEVQTKYAMKKWYAARGIDGNRLLMERRTVPVRIGRNSLGTRTASIGEWFDVERSTELLHAHFDIQYSLYGILMTMLYQAPQLDVELELRNGIRKVFRAPRPIVNAGVPISKYVGSLMEAKLLFQNQLEFLQDVGRMRFVSDQEWGFSSTFSYELYSEISEGLQDTLPESKLSTIDLRTLRRARARAMLSRFEVAQGNIVLVGHASPDRDIRGVILANNAKMVLAQAHQLDTEDGRRWFYIYVGQGQLESLPPGQYSMCLGVEIDQEMRCRPLRKKVIVSAPST